MATEPQTKQRRRSPSYPGISLETALQRARELYDYQGRNPAAVDVVLQRWGYKPKSGAGMVALAALKKFGLIDDEGSGGTRRAKLSRRALSILLDEQRESPDRQEAIRTAALEPPVHRELWERYEEALPGDEVLATYLRLERHFTDRAVREFIPQFRETLAFAGLTGDGATVSRHEGDSEPPVEEPGVTQPPATPQATGRTGSATEISTQPPQRSIQLPVPGTSWVTVQGAFPLSEDAWDQMMKLLDAMKPGLVKAAPRDDG